MSDSASSHRASDFDPEVLRLYDEYVHGQIDRRAFLDRAARFATASLSAAGLLSALSPRFAQAQQVASDDPRIQTQRLQIPTHEAVMARSEARSPQMGERHIINSAQGSQQINALLVRPVAPAPYPPVLVIHENRGLNPHIEDIARRLALAGYMALAPDALTPLGGYPGDEDQARALFQKLDREKTTEDFIAAANFLQAHPHSNGRLGAVGFCWGGGMVNTLATQLPQLQAAVPFYGPAPALDQVKNIQAELLLHFAEHDERVNATWPAYEAALKAAKTTYTAHIYPGVQHAFNNDTTARYDSEAAKLAWQRTVIFFNCLLKT